MSPSQSAIMDSGSMQTLLTDTTVVDMNLHKSEGSKTSIEFGDGMVVDSSDTVMLGEIKSLVVRELKKFI